MIRLVKGAKKEIIFIDNYVDINTLNILYEKNQSVDITIMIAGKGRLS